MGSHEPSSLSRSRSSNTPIPVYDNAIRGGRSDRSGEGPARSETRRREIPLHFLLPGFFSHRRDSCALSRLSALSHRYGNPANETPHGLPRSSGPTPIATWPLLARPGQPRKGLPALDCSGATRMPLTLRMRAPPGARGSCLAHYCPRIRMPPLVRRSLGPVTRARLKRRGALARCPARAVRACRFRANTTLLTPEACHQFLYLRRPQSGTLQGVNLSTPVVCRTARTRMTVRLT